MAWINSDDTYNPGAVREAVQVLQEHADVGLVYSDANFINAQDEVIGSFPAAQTDRTRRRRGYDHVPQQTAYKRADLWKKVGPQHSNYT